MVARSLTLRTWKVEKIFSSFVLMKLPHRISSLLLTVTLVVLCRTAVGLSLPDQLSLAEKDEDTHAQIERWN